MEEEMLGNVFDIQHFSIHDGPGIRTTVFLKGCPLHCLWCHNPESHSSEPQLMMREQRCVGCGACVSVCAAKAISMRDGITITDRESCTACGACVSVCRPKARSITGKKMHVGEIVEELVKDRLFYESSGGGVTLSGGEVLLQAKFAAAVLERCKEENLHTAIETTGFSDWQTVCSVARYTDLILFDMKHMTSSEHKKYTGVGTEKILENMKRLSNELKKPIIARMPVIPGCNDSVQNLLAMGAFLTENVPTCIEVNLLPYHDLGTSKEEQLGIMDHFETYTPDEESMERHRNILRNLGLTVK